jgi:transposase-like protein
MMSDDEVFEVGDEYEDGGPAPIVGFGDDTGAIDYRGNRRRYSDRFRADAVAMCISRGYPDRKMAVGEVSRLLGVPEPTLRGWCSGKRNPPFDEDLEESKENLAGTIRRELGYILEAMDNARSKASYRDLAISFGIMVEKMRLLSDESTENINAQIAFIREGPSTIPQHLPPRTNEGSGGS